MNKQHAFWLGTIVAALTLVATPRYGWAQDFVFGNFESDVQFGGQYILDPAATGYAGWFDWQYPTETPRPTYSPVTPNTNANYITSGSYSMPWRPAQTGEVMGFPHAEGFDQGLAVRAQDLPTATRNGFFNGLLNNSHVALDMIWDGDEWSFNYLGDGWNGANARLRMNYGFGAGPGTSVLLGVESPFNPGEFGYPDIDTGNPGAPGHWDIQNFTSPHTRTMAWDYSAHKETIQNLYTAGDVNETNGWVEFVLETSVGNFVHPVTYYTDNWRFTSFGGGGPGGLTNYQLNDAVAWPGTPTLTTTGSLNLQTQFNTEVEIRPPGLANAADPFGTAAHTFVPTETFTLDGFMIRAAGAPTTGLLYLIQGGVGGTETDGFVNFGPDDGSWAPRLIDGLPYSFDGTDDRTFLVFDLEGGAEVTLQAGTRYGIMLRNMGVEGEPAANHVMYWLRASDEAHPNDYAGGNIYARNPSSTANPSELFDVAGGGRRDAALALYAVLPAPPGGLSGDFNDDGTVDAADYVVWRKNTGTTNTLPNDDNIGGTIGTAHYNLWRANFGNGGGGANASAVPEPAGWLLMSLGTCLLGLRRKRNVL